MCLSFFLDEDMDMQIISESFNLGDKTVSMETGRLARQADAAVLMSSSGTMVLVTVTSRKEASRVCPISP